MGRRLAMGSQSRGHQGIESEAVAPSLRARLHAVALQGCGQNRRSTIRGRGIRRQTEAGASSQEAAARMSPRGEMPKNIGFRRRYMISINLRKGWSRLSDRAFILYSLAIALHFLDKNS